MARRVIMAILPSGSFACIPDLYPAETACLCHPLGNPMLHCPASIEARSGCIAYLINSAVLHLWFSPDVNNFMLLESGCQNKSQKAEKHIGIYYSLLYVITVAAAIPVQCDDKIVEKGV